MQWSHDHQESRLPPSPHWYLFNNSFPIYFQQLDFHGDRVEGLKSALQLITSDPSAELAPLLKVAQEEYDSKYSKLIKLNLSTCIAK